MNQSPTLKRIAIFGSTGSIGTQALEVIAANPSLFTAEVLTAQQNEKLLIEQALRFEPNIVVIGDETKYAVVKQALQDKGINVLLRFDVGRYRGICRIETNACSDKNWKGNCASQ
jgi:1-deoxy-D-xylulose-5-phosphate reductoisomerase